MGRDAVSEFWRAGKIRYDRGSGIIDEIEEALIEWSQITRAPRERSGWVRILEMRDREDFHVRLVERVISRECLVEFRPWSGGRIYAETPPIDKRTDVRDWELA